MKKIYLTLTEIFREKWENTVVLIIMTFMIFLITQSVGFATYVNKRNDVYKNIDLEKSYWITLDPKKSVEMNEAFEKSRDDKEYRSILSEQMMSIQHVESISFIGDLRLRDNFSNNSIKMLAYDRIVMEMVNSTIIEGTSIDLENINEVLISKDLNSKYKIGSEIFIDFSNNKIEEYMNEYTTRLIVKGLIESEFLPNMTKLNNNVIVCTSKLFEEHNIHNFLHEAFVQTDTSERLDGSFNKNYLELGFLMSFTDFYSSEENGEIKLLKKQMVRQACILIICIICVASLNFVGLYSKKYEYGIFFLSGASMLDIVFLSTVRSMALIIISTFLGFAMTIKISAASQISNRIYDYKTFLLTFFIAVIIYLISSIPVYIELKDQNLIGIIKDVK